MATYIRSVQNDRIKKAIRLRDRRGRRRQGRIIVDGCREVYRALHCGVRPLEVFVSDGHVHDAGIQTIKSMLAAHRIEAAVVTDSVFRKIAFGDRAEGIVLVAAEPCLNLEDLQLPHNALICVLEGVEKPGNVGAILRTADAAAVDAVIIADGGTDVYNPNAIRASLGAIFHLPVRAARSSVVVQWLRQGNFAIFASRVEGATHYARADYRGKSALVVGSEADGLSSIWMGEEITDVMLPMLGIVDSLNVSATAAVLCYEALRQRRSERH
ncbi:MAG: TrmH family RNA methyltransferase [Planctomycetota bacterium]